MAKRRKSGRLKSGRRLLWLAGIVLVVLTIGGTAYYTQRKYAHSDQRIRRLIRESAERHGLEHALVLGVVRRESNFDPTVRGAAGEYGLMQVTRIAARDWERANRRTIRFDNDLFDPELNLEIGTWYLAQGWKRYRNHPDRTVLALSYYNAGPGRASDWADKYKENLLERIPFSSTREYINKVCEYRDNYRKKVGQ